MNKCNFKLNWKESELENETVELQNITDFNNLENIPVKMIISILNKSLNILDKNIGQNWGLEAISWSIGCQVKIENIYFF